MKAPAVGTYLRPVSTFHMCYCYRLERVIGPQQGPWDREPWTQFVFTRYGLDRELMEPIADGRQAEHSLRDLVEVAPGVWREADGWDHDPWGIEPMYWREIGQRGQLQLF